MKSLRLLWAGVGLLAGAVAIQVFFSFRTAGKVTAPPELAALLPASLTGWQVRELPLSATEADATDAKKLLNFDRYLYREYRHGAQTITVYIAYWAAGKMPLQDVACHTPDVCWVGSGWTCLKSRSKVELRAGPVGLFGGEYRIFTAGSAPVQHVYFWHIAMGRIFLTYGRRFASLGEVAEWWAQIVRQPLVPPQEQYFIRLASNVPLDALADDLEFQKLLGAVQQLMPARSGPEGR